MADKSDVTARLWGVIVSSGLQEEYERDFLGRIKSKRTNLYISVQANPELIQLLAGANTTLGIATSGATNALAVARDTLRRQLTQSEKPAPD